MGEPRPLGAHVQDGGVGFSVWSGAAERVWLCLFDDRDRESKRLELQRDEVTGEIGRAHV